MTDTSITALTASTALARTSALVSSDNGGSIITIANILGEMILADLPTGIVTSIATRTGAVTLEHTDILDWTTATAGFGSGGAVTSVATRTGAVTLEHTDILDWSTATAGFLTSAYTLTAATSGVLGGVKPDGTTISNTAGAISVTYGTAANTAAEGNDSRIVAAQTATQVVAAIAAGNPGAFTTLSASGTVSGAGFANFATLVGGKVPYSELPASLAALPLVCSIPGTPGSAITLWYIPVVNLLTIAAGFAGSLAIAAIAATAASTFTLSYIRGGVTTAIGTIVFGAGSTTGTFSASSLYTAALGDILLLTSPTIADITLANIGITVLANRS